MGRGQLTDGGGELTKDWSAPTVGSEAMAFRWNAVTMGWTELTGR